MANLSNVVEISVRHFLLTGSFLHFVEESVEVELRTQVLEATETKRLSVTKQPDVIYYSILQQLFNFNRFASVKFYPHYHLQIDGTYRGPSAMRAIMILWSVWN